MVCLLAQEFSVPDIVSVVHDEENMGLFERIGVNTMENPQRLIAEYLHRAVKRPSIVDFMRVGEGAPIAGRTMQEAGLIGEDLLVIAIERKGTDDPITPPGVHPGGAGGPVYGLLRPGGDARGDRRVRPLRGPRRRRGARPTSRRRERAVR